MAQKAREVKIELRPATVTHEDAIRRVAKATEILMEIDARMRTAQSDSKAESEKEENETQNGKRCEAANTVSHARSDA